MLTTAPELVLRFFFFVVVVFRFAWFSLVWFEIGILCITTLVILELTL